MHGRTKEVANISMILYDEKEVLEKYLESEINEAVQVAVQETEMATVKRMLKDNIPVEMIMKYFGLSQSVILELQKEQSH